MALKVVSFIKATPVFAQLIKQIECSGNLFICRDESFDMDIKRSRGINLSIKREVQMEFEL